MKKLFVLLAVLFFIYACNELPQSEDPPIVEGLPSMAEIADSLNAVNAQALKWSIERETDSVRYAADDSVDWTREFQAFLKDNVNLLRYKDAYNLSDSSSGDERFVRFRATGKKQEVRRVEIDLRDGKIVRYMIEKKRNNLFSSSHQRFIYDGAHFELSIDQEIQGVFRNKQYLYGSILPKGDVYRGTLDLTDDLLPFILVIKDSSLLIKNGSELMPFHRGENVGDSLVFEADFFNSRFVFTPDSESTLDGRWINAKRDDVRSFNFHADQSTPFRFPIFKTTDQQIAGNHLLVFKAENGNNDSALLVLQQHRHLLQGSILTPTGDYRFLEGGIAGDSIFLSTLDGTHGYLFKAQITNKKTLEGVFKSGKTWRQSWTAYLDQPFKMTDPERLTRIKENARFHFSFMSPEGEVISLGDERFRNKPTLVSIMGTWCSNCLDEVRFLKELRAKHTEDELAIVALDFELVSDTTTALNNIKRYRERLELNFPVLLASVGTTKQKATEALPALSQITSYPTLIVLNNNHEVVRIHTGFSGPATGNSYFEDFRKEYLALIAALVKP